MALPIMTDEEFLAAVADKDYPQEFNQAMLELRREGLVQIFDDFGEPLIVKPEWVN